MQKFKKIVSVLLTAVIVFILSPSPVFAYSPPSADKYDFAVTDIKILTAPPYREENPFEIGITVTYNATNYGYLEEQPDRWVDCPKCGGSGTITVGGTETCPDCGGKGRETKNVICYCSIGTAPPDKPYAERGSHKCRPECDGWDYICERGHACSNNYGGYQYCKCGAPLHRDHVCDCVFEETKTYICPTCNGSGKVGENAHDVECPGCHGEGGKYVPVPPIWIPPTRPSEGHTQLSFTIDGLNQDYAIKDITVPIEGESVDTSRNGDGWSVWGSEYYEIELNTGENIGSKDVEARINWDYKNRETNGNNNSKSTNIDVIPATNLQVEFITPNADYRTDTDVITTYRILNKDDIGAINIRPKHNLTAEFKAIDSSTNKILVSCTKSDIVIPQHGSNIVYFKWHVPREYNKNNIKLQCDINTTKVKGSVGVPGVNEMDYTDNTAINTHKVVNGEISITPDTKLELKTPNEFDKTVAAPTNDNSNNLTSAEWEEWQWENNWYVKVKNNAFLSVSSSIKVDNHGGYTSVDKDTNKQITRSGYGINSKVISKSKASNVDMVTKVQRCYGLFRDFNYSSNYGKCRTLEPTNENANKITYEFYKNDVSFEKCRVHFIPIWMPNGKYLVSFVVSDYWTPGGMISGYATDYILIDGSMYDDWNTVRGGK